MAQACVMVQPKTMEPVLTPAKGPQSVHQDSSLITSAIRKRKVEQPDGQADPEKKARAVVGYGLAGALQALQAQEACHQQQQHQQPWPRQQQEEAAGQAATSTAAAGEEEADATVTLFSPVFHSPPSSSTCEAAAEALCQAECQQAAEAGPGPSSSRPAETSTEEHSTSTGCGTTATADTSGGSSLDCTGGGPASAAAFAAAETATCAAVTSSTAGTCAVSAVPPASPLPPQAQAVEVEAEEEDPYLDFDPFVFIKRLPPVDQCIPPRRHFLLPRQTRRSKRKTLVLDLDETLVHSTLDGYVRSDFVFPVEVGSVRHMVSVRQRPHLHTFLQRVAELFEVVVFTASQRVYAEQLLNLVDPGRCLIRHRVFRDSCVFWEGNYLKDLTVLGRDLAHTIIVDNSPQAFGFQLDNGIPIESWYDDDSDQELLKLLPFLEEIAGAEDVRPHIQHRFRLRQLVEAAPQARACPLLLC